VKKGCRVSEFFGGPGEAPRTVIELDDVRASLDGHVVLEGITFSVKEGVFLGVVGPNGAGKTTLIRVMLGLVKPDRGRVLVLGMSPRELHHELHHIGYMPQTVLFDPSFPASVSDVVMMGRACCIGPLRFASRSDRRAVAESIHEVDLDGLDELAAAPLEDDLPDLTIPVDAVEPPADPPAARGPWLGEPGGLPDPLETLALSPGIEDEQEALARNPRLAHLTMWFHAPSKTPCLTINHGMLFTNAATNPPGFLGAFVPDADGQGYTMEYAIPWSLLGCDDDPPRRGDVLAAVWQVLWGDEAGRMRREQMVEIRNPDEPLRINVWERAATWGRAEYR